MMADLIRIALVGNVDRGRNRALSMANLYGTADHLNFRNREEAQAVVNALAAAGYPAHVNVKEVPPTEQPLADVATKVLPHLVGNLGPGEPGEGSASSDAYPG